MARFCPQCGKAASATDRYCEECGAPLEASLKVQKKELKLEKPPAPVQAPTGPSEQSNVIGDIFGLIIGVLVIVWIGYSIGCATGAVQAGGIRHANLSTKSLAALGPRA